MCVEIAKRFLESPITVDICVKTTIARYSTDFSSNIVLCGNSPYAKYLFTQFNRDMVEVVDTEPTCSEKSISFLESSSGDTIYLITTSKYLGYYAELLAKKKRVIPYTALPLIDNRFNFPRRVYASNFTIRRIKSILDNKHVFLKMLDEIEDVESVEILAKWISYSLTCDIKHASYPFHDICYWGGSIWEETKS